jgi:hypothetical protein
MKHHIEESGLADCNPNACQTLNDLVITGDYFTDVHYFNIRRYMRFILCNLDFQTVGHNPQLYWAQPNIAPHCGPFTSTDVVEFFLRHRIQTKSEAHPTSYSMGTEVFYPGSNAAGA